MKRLLILFCVLLMSFSADKASGESKLKRDADKLFLYFDFSEAVTLYEKLYAKDPENTEVIERIADCYRLMNDMVNAEKWYAELIEKTEVISLTKFYYAQALRSNEKYDLALKYFTEYISFANKTYTKDLVQKQRGWQDLLKTINTITVNNLLELNSEQSEFSPMFYRDSNLIFVSNSKGKNSLKDDWSQRNFFDLYVSRIGKDKVEAPHIFANNKLNGNYHEGPVTFTKGYGSMFITRSNYQDNKFKKGSDDKTVTLKIYKVNYEKDVDNWSNITEAFPFNSNDYNVCHPALSYDNQYMVFASDMPGGQGGTDLWITQNLGNEWTKPLNLGPFVNTPGEEKFPFLSADGELYFSSDGHYGLGGLDVYKSKIKFTTAYCERPENLGVPFNSSKDDFGFIMDKYNFMGYFSSNRPGGLGEDDIYKWENKTTFIYVHITDEKGKTLSDADVKLLCDGLNPKKVKSNKEGIARIEVIPECACTLKVNKSGYLPKTFAVRVNRKNVEVNAKLTKQNKPELKLEILILDKKNNEPMPGVSITITSRTAKEKIKATTDQEGKLLVAGVKENIEVDVLAAKFSRNENKRYLASSKQVSTIGKLAPAYLKEVIFLEEAERNVGIKMEKVYFDPDKADIKTDAFTDLDYLIKVMQDNPTLEIELGCHSDCKGNFQRNMNLTSKQAENLVSYIISKGIDPNRIIATGYGESALLNDCACEGDRPSPCSESQHQINRRTEFKVIKF